MKVHFKLETESRLTELASKSGRAPGDLVEDALAGYLAEVAEVREMLDGRYDDIRGLRIPVADGRGLCANISRRVFVADHLRAAALKTGVQIPDEHRFGLHNMRQSFSHWLVNKAKVEPKTVQSILRHSRIQTTRYLHPGRRR
jgi:integrase